MPSEGRPTLSINEWSAFRTLQEGIFLGKLRRMGKAGKCICFVSTANAILMRLPNLEFPGSAGGFQHCCEVVSLTENTF